MARNRFTVASAGNTRAVYPKVDCPPDGDRTVSRGTIRAGPRPIHRRGRKAFLEAGRTPRRLACPNASSAVIGSDARPHPTPAPPPVDHRVGPRRVSAARRPLSQPSTPHGGARWLWSSRVIDSVSHQLAGFIGQKRWRLEALLRTEVPGSEERRRPMGIWGGCTIWVPGDGPTILPTVHSDTGRKSLVA
jgi:hypothetical protein